MTYNDPTRSETHQPVTWPRRNTAMREMLAKSEPKPKGAVRFLVKLGLWRKRSQGVKAGASC